MNMNTLFLFIMRTVGINTNWTEPFTKISDEYFDPYLTAVFTNGAVTMLDQVFTHLGPVIIYDVKENAPEVPQKFIKSRNVLIVQVPLKSAVKFDDYFFINAQSRVLVITLDSPKEWLDRLWRWSRAINTVVLSMDTLKTHTWFPYKAGECMTVTNITEISENLFPEKLGSNLNNCELRVTSSELYPFVFDETDGNYQQGVETNIMKSFASKYNMNRTFVSNGEEFFWSGVVPGFGPLGCLRLVHQNLADFAIGGLALNYEWLPYADASLSHFEDSLSWFVPIPNFIPNVEKIPKTVSGNYRVYLSITLVLITTVAGIIAHSTSTSIIDTIFNCVRVYVFSPVIMPKHRILKLLIMFTYFFTMHITIGFQSALIYLLANDVSEVPITDITQALDRNMKFYFTNYHSHLINQSGTGSLLTNAIMEKNLYIFDEYVHYDAFAFNKTGVFLGPKAPSPYYLKATNTFDQYGRLIMTPLREPFNSNPNIILAVKGHPLLLLFDRTCEQLREAGIIDWWLISISPDETITVVKENAPLSIEALIGAFIILGIFLFSSLMAFIGEVFIHKWMRCRGKDSRKRRGVSFIK